MYFEMAARDIRALPKLEGTVHVNMALVLKFMANYLFNPAEYPPVPGRRDAADDEFLFRQGPARGLGKIQFHDWRATYAEFARRAERSAVRGAGRGAVHAADERPAHRGAAARPRLPARARRAIHTRGVRAADPGAGRGRASWTAPSIRSSTCSCGTSQPTPSPCTERRRRPRPSRPGPWSTYASRWSTTSASRACGLRSGSSPAHTRCGLKRTGFLSVLRRFVAARRLLQFAALDHLREPGAG